MNTEARQIAEKLKVAEDKLDYEGQPEVIYLEPLGGEGTWCTERQWEDDEVELGKLPAKYIRADLYLALEARCQRYEAALKEIALDVPPIDGDIAIIHCEENYDTPRAALDNGGQK